MILVTGGPWFIGSHAYVALTTAGLDFVLFDKCSNSERSDAATFRKHPWAFHPHLRRDVRDRALLSGISEQHAVDAVIYFAGMKAVGASSQKPRNYYSNNVKGTLARLSATLSASHFVHGGSGSDAGWNAK